MKVNDFIKPTDCTGTNATQPNEVSLETIANMLNKLGNSIEPKPIIPMPIPYALAKIKEV